MANDLDQLGNTHDHRLTEAERHALHLVLHRKTGGIRNINEVEAESRTAGARAADALARVVGSWGFIIVQGVLLSLWLLINGVGWVLKWDPYPFILLNLVLSFQAAFTAPIIMMSQNRQDARDRLDAEQDYAVDRRAELEIAAIHARLDELAGRQWDALVTLQREQLELLRRIEMLTTDVHQRTAPTS